MIALRKILKDADVWLMSARWWTDLQEINLFKRYNLLRCMYAHHGYHCVIFGLEVSKSVIFVREFHQM